MSQDADATTFTNVIKGKGKSNAHPSQPDLVDDIVAGWLGGALGILAKVRMQTAIPAAIAADTPSTPRAGAGSRPPSGTREGLILLWRTEGVRFLVAGAAAPILGLAFIDSAFFALYGRTMSILKQDRQDPYSLPWVFASGSLAGGVCALLQTPIEVIKCRAQVENQASSKKLGSFGIARLTARQEGLKGFYHGGLTTAFRDTLSSGIFFTAYITFRRLLRGDAPFHSNMTAYTAGESSSSSSHFDSNRASSAILKEATPVPDIEANPPNNSTPYSVEIMQTLLAGGLAGSLSAIIPYPLDIIKTRLQTVHSQPAPTLTSVARQIYSDGMPIVENETQLASGGEKRIPRGVDHEDVGTQSLLRRVSTHSSEQLHRLSSNYYLCRGSSGRISEMARVIVLDGN
ncbi:MAG: hypothetical protein CYPHOPRED_003618 [Cyphobasidiales sp. Tagirdzhanova-0007]|nr:MAG: hypothetical protein CYPHOPRED_003618 [Cyphobasidiales sp. Tagirdzhanova-0007]